MCDAPDYTIHRRHHHFGWDNTIPPVAHVDPGERLRVECLESSGGRLTKASRTADLARLSTEEANPVTGPIHVAGAAAGDVLKIEMEHFAPSGWGWTANIPGFGLLADQFPDPALNIWSFDPAEMAPALFSNVARVPLKPFAGTIGLAPAAPGRHSVIPPRRVGGNMDVRDLAAGSVLYLPVEADGALLSVGDTHAAQGDGEVCGTAIESPMTVDLRIDLIKDAPLRSPRFTTPGPVLRHLDAAGYDVTTGIGPDLMSGAKDAVAEMIELLGRAQGLSAVDAYMLCSVCGDLRISEVVDVPNWVVSFYMPRIIFE